MKRSKRRKIYQKRRKRQRLKKMQSRDTSNGRTDQRNHRESDIPILAFANSPTIETNSYSQSLCLWWRNYCTAIAYYQEQQRQWSYQQRIIDVNYLRQHDVLQYETSSEEENYDQEYDEDEHIRANFTEEVDLEYLKFLEITNKHREELRLSKEKEKYINQ